MKNEQAWDGKTRGGVLGYRIFFFFLKKLGLGFTYFILIFVAFYFLIFSFKSTKANYYFFRKIMKRSVPRTIINIYQSYYVFGQSILDKVAVLAGMKDRFETNSTGLENLYEAVETGKGVFLLSAHLGNWEIAGHFLEKLNTPVNIVLFDNEHQSIKKMLKSEEKLKKFNIIPYSNDFSHLIAINRAIKNSEIVCLHGDRFHEGSKTIEIDFVGQKALFPSGPFKLVNKFKVPFCYVFAIKSGMYNYDFYAFRGKNEENKVENIINGYVERLEIMLNQYPKQWFNYYQFWQK